MTFLDICKRAVLEASIADSGPSSVVGVQTKQFQRMINWCADAWRELQGQHTWAWQWESVPLTIKAGTNVSDVAQSIAPVRWDKDAVTIGSSFLDYFPWEQFRQMYPAATISPGQPNAWSIRPDLAFVVNTKPTSDTVINVERYANPTELDEDGDIPGMPADLHMYIVWAAVMKYAARDEAGSLYATSEKFANDIKATIMERCLPQISLGGPLC